MEAGKPSPHELVTPAMQIRISCVWQCTELPYLCQVSVFHRWASTS